MSFMGMKLLSHPMKLSLFFSHKYPTTSAKLNDMKLSWNSTETGLIHPKVTQSFFAKKKWERDRMTRISISEMRKRRPYRALIFIWWWRSRIGIEGEYAALQQPTSPSFVADLATSPSNFGILPIWTCRKVHGHERKRKLAKFIGRIVHAADWWVARGIAFMADTRCLIPNSIEIESMTPPHWESESWMHAFSITRDYRTATYAGTTKLLRNH